MKEKTGSQDRFICKLQMNISTAQLFDKMVLDPNWLDINCHKELSEFVKFWLLKFWYHSTAIGCPKQLTEVLKLKTAGVYKAANISMCFQLAIYKTQRAIKKENHS